MRIRRRVRKSKGRMLPLAGLGSEHACRLAVLGVTTDSSSNGHIRKCRVARRSMTYMSYSFERGLSGSVDRA